MYENNAALASYDLRTCKYSTMYAYTEGLLVHYSSRSHNFACTCTRPHAPCTRIHVACRYVLSNFVLVIVLLLVRMQSIISYPIDTPLIPCLFTSRPSARRPARLNFEFENMYRSRMQVMFR